MQAIRAVIFDLDGTLYDKRGLTRHIIFGEWRHLWFLSREREARLKLRGENFGSQENFYKHFFECVSPKHPDRARKWYMEHYMPLQVDLLRRYFHANDWVIPRLERLRREGKKIAVYSDYDFAAEKLKAIGIDPSLFDIVTCSAELGGLKPSRKSIMRLLERLDVNPREALIVGDRHDTDGACARKIKARFELIDYKKK